VLDAHPGFIEARAELVVALALELDDVKVEQALRRQEAGAAQRERELLERALAPEGWEKQAVQLRSVQAAKQGAAEQLEPRVEQLTARAEEALRRLEPEGGRVATPEEQRARVRAQALLGAVQGAPGSMARAEQLRADGGGQGWDVIAEAEYVLNAPSSSLGPTARNDSVRALEALRQRDAAFLRSYVLGARLALAAGERRSAAALLDMAVALNPTHEVARTLQELARSENTARDATP
jgi:hypothetical protein